MKPPVKIFKRVLSIAIAFLWAATTQGAAVISLDGQWLLAPDPQNTGRDGQWWTAARPEAKPAKVPWIIQDAFPGYHGVAWYWKEFAAPANPNPGGRTLLRFWQVDYKADVWLNDAAVGAHEGGESPFVFDVTGVIKPGAKNRLAVRVVNPTHQPIDGLVLNETPHRNKALPYTSGSAWDQGGVWDSVELLLVPAVWVEDLFVRPDWKTGQLRVQVNLRNAGPEAVQGQVRFTVAPAATGETLVVSDLSPELKVGDTLLETTLKVEGPRLWDLEAPFLYRVTARVLTGQPSPDNPQAGLHEHSVRCGFRDFRFENGAFRLNGRRIYLRCSHTGNCCPIGLELPHDPDYLRRDLINQKMMRYNAMRFIAGVAKRQQLDLADELGLMVYEESYAGWCLGNSAKMKERYNESLLGMLRRDRNHPCITIWGLLNETPDGPVFRHAASLLPEVRQLDDSRLVMLNSGRFDQTAIGSLSNPGSSAWEDLLADLHPYQRVPHTAQIIQTLRTLSGNGKPVWLSEYGIGSAMDLLRTVRWYEQVGKTEVEDAQLYRNWRDQYLADWQRYRLAEVFDRPEDFFTQSIARMAGQRLLGINAIRSNPNVIGHSLTGTLDQGMTAEGVWTTFRELKPGAADALFDAWAPLRWCLFVEPVNVYARTPVKLEAVLANEDVLAPGQYPVRLQVVGPDLTRVFEKTLTVSIADPKSQPEPPMVQPVFAQEVVIDGPPGAYRFLATFEKGAAACGEQVKFFVDAASEEMPKVEAEVVLMSQDTGLAKWLAEHGIMHRPYAPGRPTAREVILASGKPSADPAAVFPDLAQRIACGSTVVFLTTDTYAKGDQLTGWLPLKTKGRLSAIARWLYHADDWAKRHPIFEGLQAGGLMDYSYYRELIPDVVFAGLEPAADPVAGGINASWGYQSGLLLAVYKFGAGQFILNSLLVRDNLGKVPQAERLLRNLLRFAARDAAKPSAALPADFNEQLKAVGY
ncbi:MAG: sugar-binding domain-containing protein [Verrucomicrobiota bacterium]|jgi:hypothetical protein